MKPLRWAGLLLLFLSAPSAIAASAEYELKAAFIARFTEFIDWPASPTPNAPFKICVLGAHPIEEALAKLPALLKVKNRPLQIQRIDSADDATQCELVFIPRESSKLVRGVQKAAENHPVLIVSEAPGLLQQGALVNFYNEGERLRFEINLPEVKRADLKISSRLLKLATVVE